MIHKVTNEAGTEIMGTMLLLGIAVTVFSVVSLTFLGNVPSNDEPLVSISGAVEGNYVKILHKGGEPLSLETVVVITISGNQLNFTAEDLLEKEYKEDGFWEVGERLLYDGQDLTDKQVEATVVEPLTEKTLLMGILKHA